MSRFAFAFGMSIRLFNNNNNNVHLSDSLALSIQAWTDRARESDSAIAGYVAVTVARPNSGTDLTQILKRIFKNQAVCGGR